MTIYIHKPFCNTNHAVKHNINSMILRDQKLKLYDMFNRNEIAYSSKVKFFRTIYYREFSLAGSNPFLACMFE